MDKRERQARFEAAVDGHRRLLAKVCRLYARDRDDQDDLAAEIVLQLWRAFPRYDPAGRFSTWMARVALNVAISHVRRETRRARHAAPADHALEVEAEKPSEEAQALYRLIAELAPLDRALMLLHLEGHSHAEVAEVLGLSTTNVATKIARTKAALKDET